MKNLEAYVGTDYNEGIIFEPIGNSIIVKTENENFIGPINKINLEEEK